MILNMESVCLLQICVNILYAGTSNKSSVLRAQHKAAAVAGCQKQAIKAGLLLEPVLHCLGPDGLPSNGELKGECGGRRREGVLRWMESRRGQAGVMLGCILI